MVCHQIGLDLQGSFETSDQIVRLKRLAEKANRTTRKSPLFQPGLMARRDHDHRRRGLVGHEVLFEVDTTQARHLDVRNDAGKALNRSASQERLGGGEPWAS